MYTIEIKTDNEAFEGFEGGEVARILIALAKECQDNGSLAVKGLYDINGNRVGIAKIK